jgi:hypothetical protein
MEPLIIFTHIPKTAGSTITSVIDSVYRPRETAKIFTHTDGPAFMKELSPEVRFLTGHYPFGLHQYTDRPCRYFTFLRDPAERVISLYYYLRRAKDHPSHERIASGRETFLDVVKSQPNEQTWYLSGLDRKDPRSGKEKLNLALEHLQKHYAVPGFLEHFDESLLLLQEAFQWRFSHYRAQNVTKKRPAREAVSAEVQDAIASHNEFDQTLYIFAKTRYDAAIAAQPPSFHQRLQRLRTRTAQMRKFYTFTEAVHRLLKRATGRS